MAVQDKSYDTEHVWTCYYVNCWVLEKYIENFSFSVSGVRACPTPNLWYMFWSTFDCVVIVSVHRKLVESVDDLHLTSWHLHVVSVTSTPRLLDLHTSSPWPLHVVSLTSTRRLHDLYTVVSVTYMWCFLECYLLLFSQLLPSNPEGSYIDEQFHDCLQCDRHDKRHHARHCDRHYAASRIWHNKY